MPAGFIGAWVGNDAGSVVLREVVPSRVLVEKNTLSKNARQWRQNPDAVGGGGGVAAWACGLLSQPTRRSTPLENRSLRKASNVSARMLETSLGILQRFKAEARKDQRGPKNDSRTLLWEQFEEAENIPAQCQLICRFHRSQTEHAF